ncbi:MAG TPA: hypothetical protein VMA31_15670 [Bryobacteraceae bacterium]|nr:hypothetical protein [Bryobacteraceae bacterium]
MRELRRGADKPCSCIFRAIFKLCYSRFCEFAAAEEQPGSVSLDSAHGPSGYRSYSFKRQEYVADFCLAARRALTEPEYKLFRYTFLLGADSQLCCRYLGMERGYYFHAVYRLEAKLGRYFAEIEPYPLYPVDEYMGGTVRSARIVMQSELEPRRRRRERLPMTA